MGVERAVTRWYALRQTLTDEIVRLEAKVAQLSDTVQASGDSVATTDLQLLQKDLARVQERLRLLGPCPQPMMG